MSYRWDRTLSLPRNAEHRSTANQDRISRNPLHEDPVSGKKYFQNLALGSPSRPYAYETSLRTSMRDSPVDQSTTTAHRSRRLSGGSRRQINNNQAKATTNNYTVNNTNHKNTYNMRSSASVRSNLNSRQNSVNRGVDNRPSSALLKKSTTNQSVRTLNSNITGINSLTNDLRDRSVYSENVPPPITSPVTSTINVNKAENINKTVSGALKRRKHIVLLGLDGSGKTTLLMRMKFGGFVGTAPTIGFNHEKVWAGGFRWSAWDVGGGERQRPLWVMYSRATDGIIFVVDASSHPDRLEEARLELVRVIKTSKSTSHQLDVPPPPVLVLANFQDRNTALGPSELAQFLSLSEPWASNIMWAVAPVCGLSGDGVDHALTTLRTLIDGRKKEKPKKEVKRWRW